MIHYILAGFELELYAVHEYHYIFWLVQCKLSGKIAALNIEIWFLMTVGSL